MSSRSSLDPSSNRNNNGNHQPQSKRFGWLSWRGVARFFIAVALILSAVWLLMAIYYHFGISSPITWLVALIVFGLLGCWLTLPYYPKLAYKLTQQSVAKNSELNTAHINTNNTSNSRLNKSKLSNYLVASYGLVWLLGLGWFNAINPKQDRNWQPEVSQAVSYTRDPSNPDLITLSNVRNFDWHPSNGPDEIAPTERWETRTVDISKLSGIDIANSYWMGPLIAHTLVSFRFEDDRPLAFSLEIRKEEEESFSALAGFFRRFELSLIASEERDIIYTRTNVRGEQVYLFPISHLQQSEVKSLFESYLTAADELNAEPAWYNTLTSNCTNIIFYMARIVSGERLPWDYRIWVSGWLPNYLYDIGMLDASSQIKEGSLKQEVVTDEPQSTQPWSMDTWYEHTHINPKVIGFDNQAGLDTSNNSAEFSKQIRQGIPIPPLADSTAEAETQAQSASETADK